MKIRFIFKIKKSYLTIICEVKSYHTFCVALVSNNEMKFFILPIKNIQTVK